MSLNFTEASLVDPTQLTLQITKENIDELAESLNGKVTEGILNFKLSNHEHFAVAGDWIVLFQRGRDALTFTDKMYQRLYNGL